MGFPIIKVSSTAGGASDTACSGAGPATALTGTAARQRAGITNPLRIGLFGFTGSLAAVATDGTNTILFNDTTAGYRSHASIAAVRDVRDTGLANMTATSVALTLDGSPAAAFAVGDVIKITGAGAAGADLYTTIAVVYTSTSYDVSDAAGTTVSLATYECPKAVGITAGETGIVVTADTVWAIGGVRASLFGTLSRKLLANNATLGDAMPGWTVEFQSAHAESTATAIIVYRSGDTTSGKIVVGTASGAAVRPVVTVTAGSVNCFTFSNGVNYYTLRGFKITKSVAGATAGEAISIPNSVSVSLYDMHITATGTSLWNIATRTSTNMRVENCYFDGFTYGVYGASSDAHIIGNYFANGTTAILKNNGSLNWTVEHNIFTTVSTCFYGANYLGAGIVRHNIAYRATPPGTSAAFLNVDVSSSGTQNKWIVDNNIVSGFDIAFTITGTSPRSSLYLQVKSEWQFRNNVIYNTTTQITSGYESLLSGTITTDPAFTSAGTLDFSVGAAMKALGWPDFTISGTLTRSYIDPGPQRQEPSGGGVIIIED